MRWLLNINIAKKIKKLEEGGGLDQKDVFSLIFRTSIRQYFLAFCFTGLFGLCGGNAFAGPEGPMRVVGEGGTEAQGQTLGCSDKIFAYSSIPGGLEFPLVIRFQWIRPGGIIQEETSVPLKEPLKPGAEVYSWLKIDSGGGVMGDFVFGGDYGARREVFDGEWRVVVRVGNKEINHRSFNVVCQR